MEYVIKELRNQLQQHEAMVRHYIDYGKGNPEYAEISAQFEAIERNHVSAFEKAILILEKEVPA